MKDPNVIRDAVKFLLADVVATTHDPSRAHRATDHMQNLDEFFSQIAPAEEVPVKANVEPPPPHAES